MPRPNEKQQQKREAELQRERGYLLLFTRVYVVFVLAIYPLYVSADKYTNIVYRKAHAYWIFSVLFIIGFLLFFIPHILGVRALDIKTGQKKPPLWRRLDFIDWAAITYMAIITLSSLLSEYQGIVWLGFINRHDGWLTMFCMIACFVIISRWYRPVDEDFCVFAVSLIAVSLIGILQFFGMDIFQLYPSSTEPGFLGLAINYRSTIGNIDFLSCYAAMAAMVFAALFVRSEKRVRYLYFFASVMAVELLVVAGPYQGKVGLMGACFLMLPYWFAEKKYLGRFLVMVSAWGLVTCLHHYYLYSVYIPSLNDPSRRPNSKSIFSDFPFEAIIAVSAIGLVAGLGLICVKKIGWPKPKTARVAGCAALASVIVLGLLSVEIIGARVPKSNVIYQAREVMHGNLEDSFGSGRGFTWKRAVARIPEVPLLGTGADTFMQAYGEENQEASREAMGVAFDKAHNDFLQVALCYGIPGLLAYLALIGGVFLKSAKKAFDDGFLMVAAGGALSYVVCSFFGIDTVIVTPIYWLLLAFAHGRQLLPKEETVAP